MRRKLSVDLVRSWEPSVAKAARMSGKFFLDSERGVEGTGSHVAELLAASHDAYYAKERRYKILDFLRDDLAVVYVDGVPYTSSVAAHFLLGLDGEHARDSAILGRSVESLARGIGESAGALFRLFPMPQHGPSHELPAVFYDSKIRSAFPCTFRGTSPLPLLGALWTIQSFVRSASLSARRAACDWCAMGAERHRFIALFHASAALLHLEKNEKGILPETLQRVLGSADGSWLLAQSKLRNGLVHYGLEDISGSIDGQADLASVFAAYTELPADEVSRRVSTQLRHLDAELTSWMMSPAPRGRGLASVLRRVT